MQKKQILGIIAVCLFGLFGLWGYRQIRALGVRYVAAKIITILHKEYYLFPKIGSLKHFYELKPHAVDTDSPSWLGYTATYLINDDGINAKQNYPITKPEHTIRIITLGDSFTFGQYVNTSSAYPAQLEDLLNQAACPGVTYEVLNLGISGYDISYTIQHYMHTGEKYSSDIVIWLLNGHNFYQDNEYELEREQEILALTDAKIRNTFDREANYYFARRQAQSELLKIIGTSRLLTEQQSYLTQFAQIYKGPLVISIFDSMTDSSILSLLSKYASQRNHTWLDKTLPDLNSRGETLQDGHPNIAGHTTIAQHMYEYMTQHNLLSACE